MGTREGEGTGGADRIEFIDYLDSDTSTHSAHPSDEKARPNIRSSFRPKQRNSDRSLSIDYC